MTIGLRLPVRRHSLLEQARIIPIVLADDFFHPLQVRSETPERFAFPSGILGISLFTGVAVFSGAVPGIVTVTSCVSIWSRGPWTIRKYVVVCRGVTSLLPRARTAPISGSIETPIGFSTTHSSRTGCPAFEVAGCAVNRATRALSSGVPLEVGVFGDSRLLPPDRPPPLPAR